MNLMGWWGNLLPGYKTYIVAFIGAVLNFASWVGWIDQDFVNHVNAILIALGLGGLRAGMKTDK